MPSPSKNFPWYVYSLAILGSTLMFFGGVVALINPAMLVGNEDATGGAVRIYAGYLVARNLAMGGMLLGTLLLRNAQALRTMMLLAGIVQVLDAVIDCAEGRWAVVPIVALLGAGFLVAAFRKQAWSRPPAGFVS